MSGTDPNEKSPDKAGDSSQSNNGGAENALPKDLPKIPGITLHYEIARGGMGVVYSGRQDFLDRRVAVKFLSMDLGGDAFARRFQREAKILAGISHPNIVGCHMADTTPEGQSYLVMEFCDGPSLKAWIAENGPVAPMSAVRLIRASALALLHAYQSDIIHRDVKPENILLESVTSTTLDIGFPFVPKIVDLGLARMTHEQVGAGLTSPGAVMGTPSTMSPEQFDDPDSVDFRSDIYGLGCCLYEMLVGQPAFRGSKLTDIVVRKRDPNPPNPVSENSGLPAAVGAFTQRLLASNRDDRPESYKQLVAEADQLIAALMANPGSYDDEGLDRTVLSDATMPVDTRPRVPLSGAPGGAPTVNTNTPAASVGTGVSPSNSEIGGKRGLFVALGVVIVAIAAVLVFSGGSLLDTPNTAPTISSIKRSDGSEMVDDATINLGQSFKLVAVANDAEDDKLIYKWSFDRAVMSSLSENGQPAIELKLTDGLADVKFVVSLVVSDPDGEKDTKSFTVTVGDCSETMTLVGASRIWSQESGRWIDFMDPFYEGVSGRLSRRPAAGESAMLTRSIESDAYWEWHGIITPDIDSTREGDPLSYVAITFGDAGKTKGYAVSCGLSNEERDWTVELCELVPGQTKWRPHFQSKKASWTQPDGDTSDIRGWFSIRRQGLQLVLEVGESTQPPPVSGQPMPPKTITPRSKVIVDLTAEDVEALGVSGQIHLIVANGLCRFHGSRR